AKNQLETAMLMRAFNIKLRESMREDLGGVYGVGARQSTKKLPKSNITLTINWGTNPDMVDTLSKVVFNEMNHLIANGPTEDDLAKVKETTIRERESNDKQNRFWNSYLDANYFNGDVTETYETYRDAANAVTIEDLKQIARKYFTPEKYLRVVSYPVE
ncbi:MAG: insulinase family protein, partial [Ignavibacteria bacterium]|nr:insulinase family protein [Ignavibacteria bacterium]